MPMMRDGSFNKKLFAYKTCTPENNWNVISGDNANITNVKICILFGYYYELFVYS